MFGLCLTYRPGDDDGGAVAYVAAELAQQSILVHADPRPLVPPPHLWQGVKPLVSGRSRPAAWAIWLPAGVVGDAAALDSLRLTVAGVRLVCGAGYPAIGLGPGGVDGTPAAGLGLTMLVTLGQSAWPQKVRAILDGRPYTPGTDPRPFALALHQPAGGGEMGWVLEIKPAAGSWTTPFAAVPQAEAAQVRPLLARALAGDWREREAAAGGRSDAVSTVDGEWLVLTSSDEARKNSGLYLHCARLPSAVRFGQPGGYLRYTVRLRPAR